MGEHLSVELKWVNTTKHKGSPGFSAAWACQSKQAAFVCAGTAGAFLRGCAASQPLCPGRQGSHSRGGGKRRKRWCCEWDKLVSTLLRRGTASRRNHVGGFTIPLHQRGWRGLCQLFQKKATSVPDSSNGLGQSAKTLQSILYAHTKGCSSFWF